MVDTDTLRFLEKILREGLWRTGNSRGNWQAESSADIAATLGASTTGANTVRLNWTWRFFEVWLCFLAIVGGGVGISAVEIATTGLAGIRQLSQQWVELNFRDLLFQSMVGLWVLNHDRPRIISWARSVTRNDIVSTWLRIRSWTGIVSLRIDPASAGRPSASRREIGLASGTVGIWYFCISLELIKSASAPH